MTCYWQDVRVHRRFIEESGARIERDIFFRFSFDKEYSKSVFSLFDMNMSIKCLVFFGACGTKKWFQGPQEVEWISDSASACGKKHKPWESKRTRRLQVFKWRFPEVGVFPVLIQLLDWDFPYELSSYWGFPLGSPLKWGRYPRVNEQVEKPPWMPIIFRTGFPIGSFHICRSSTRTGSSLQKKCFWVVCTFMASM